MTLDLRPFSLFGVEKCHRSKKMPSESVQAGRIFTNFHTNWDKYLSDVSTEHKDTKAQRQYNLKRLKILCCCQLCVFPSRGKTFGQKIFVPLCLCVQFIPKPLTLNSSFTSLYRLLPSFFYVNAVGWLAGERASLEVEAFTV